MAAYRLGDLPRKPTTDGSVSVNLSVPKEMGGPGLPHTTTPEHLFAAGYAACVAAQSAVTGAAGEGNIGAGAGATVGKLLGFKQATKGGLGTASKQIARGIVVAACTTCSNARGVSRKTPTATVVVANVGRAPHRAEAGPESPHPQRVRTTVRLLPPPPHHHLHQLCG